MLQIAGTVQVVLRAQQGIPPAALFQSFSCQSPYAAASPGDVRKQLRGSLTQTDEIVAAIVCRSHHGIVPSVQCSDGFLNIPGMKVGAVGTEQNGPGSICQCRFQCRCHAAAQVCALLLFQGATELFSAVVKERLFGAGSAQEFDGGGLQISECKQGSFDEQGMQCGGAFGTQCGNETGLRLAGYGRPGEYQDLPAGHRYRRASSAGSAPRA